MTTNSPIKILVLEDDASFFKILELRLRTWRSDIEITHAPNIATARQYLDSGEIPFSLAVLDQHLPDGMGAELLSHPRFADIAVLAVSSDDAPELPANAVRGGAHHFLGKRQVSAPLFIPLLEAIIERKELERQLIASEVQKSRMESIRTLLATLQHELNNPLGAVMGAIYLLKQQGKLGPEQEEALKLLDQSSKRIKHVLEQLCDAAELQEVTKGKEQVFQVPGDAEWDKS